jgi:homoserine dehydrogenase
MFGKCQQFGGEPAPGSVAAVVSTGEIHSAAMLTLHLDCAGMSAALLTPAAIGLVAAGPPLDASPTDVTAAPLQRTLDREEVAVVPGYVAQDAHGRPCLLGRGGSDLTALFLAHRLRADCCRLVKDVDGLYERDPALPGPRPRRYAEASWSDALATDGSIVQHKAVRFAEAHAVEFELGKIGGRRPTRIGRGPAVFC